MESLSQVRRINERMGHHLEKLAGSHLVEHTRLIGGIAAFDLRTLDTSYSAGAGRALSTFAQKEGVLLRPLGNVIYLMPPYCTSDEQIDRAFEVITTFLKNADRESQDVA
jgi:adenosylmethionine-8-amino-7-oxononanoate aminotransferase